MTKYKLNRGVDDDEAGRIQDALSRPRRVGHRVDRPRNQEVMCVTQQHKGYENSVDTP